MSDNKQNIGKTAERGNQVDAEDTRVSFRKKD